MKFGIFFFALFSNFASAQFNCHQSIHLFISPSLEKIPGMDLFLESAELYLKRNDFQKAHLVYLFAYNSLKMRGEKNLNELRDLTLLTAMLAEHSPTKIFFLFRHSFKFVSNYRTLAEFRTLLEKDFPKTFEAFNANNPKKAAYLRLLNDSFKYRLSQFDHLVLSETFDKENQIIAFINKTFDDIKEIELKAKISAQLNFTKMTTENYLLNYHHSRNPVSTEEVIKSLTWEINSFNPEANLTLIKAGKNYSTLLTLTNKYLNTQLKKLALGPKWEIQDLNELLQLQNQIDYSLLSNNRLAELKSGLIKLHLLLAPELKMYFEEIENSKLHIQNLKAILDELKSSR
jgi:hypothetical protein